MTPSATTPANGSSPKTPSSRTLVTVDGVHKKFLHEGRSVHVLRGIDLTIDRGEMLSVVGPSGAGKSTLLHILGTLDLPTKGTIHYEGQDVTRYSASRLASFRNHSLGFVFQSHHLLPEFTAVENVMMPGMIRGSEKGKLKATASALLEEVGLGHRLTHRPGELSGGEQARVALARALVMNPIVVLADEPTGNLDSTTSDAIHQLFFDLNERRGTTFLIVTHNNELADSMPRKVSMRDGRIESDVRSKDSNAGDSKTTKGADPALRDADDLDPAEAADLDPAEAADLDPAGAAD